MTGPLPPVLMPGFRALRCVGNAGPGCHAAHASVHMACSVCPLPTQPNAPHSRTHPWSHQNSPPIRVVIRSCVAGKAASGASATCNDCEAGKWAAAVAATCTSCTAGKASATIAAVSIAACTQCIAGKAANTVSAASECVDCSAGQYALVESTNCTGCGVGKHYQAAGVAESDCVDCAVGKSTDSTGSSAISDCVDCGIGKYGAGGVACNDCDAGKSTLNAGKW